jgi:hypothetical protein
MYFIGAAFVGDGHHYQSNNDDTPPKKPIWIFNG